MAYTEKHMFSVGLFFKKSEVGNSGIHKVAQ